MSRLWHSWFVAKRCFQEWPVFALHSFFFVELIWHFFFVVLNLSFCSFPYLFSSRKLWSPKSNESQYICGSQVNIITSTLSLRFLTLRKKLKTNHRIRFCSRKFKLPVYYPMIYVKFSRKIGKLILELRRFGAILNLKWSPLTWLDF